MLNKKKLVFKIVFLSVIIILTGLIFIGKFKYVLQNNKSILRDNGLTKGVSIEKISDDRLEALVDNDPIDISEILMDKIVEDKYQKLFYIDNNLKKEVVQNDHSIIQFQYSPSGNQFGYLED